MSGWCLTWCLVQCDLPCNLDGVPGVARRLTGLSFCIHGAGYHSGIIPGLSLILTTVDWALCLTACLGGSHLKPLGGTLYGRDLPKQSRVFNSGIKRSEVLPLSTTCSTWNFRYGLSPIIDVTTPLQQIITWKFWCFNERIHFSFYFSLLFYVTLQI